MLISSNIQPNECLFIDIETVPQPVTEGLLSIFKKHYTKDEIPTFMLEEEFNKSAGLYAELGKICCVSVGWSDGNVFHTQSFSGDDEVTLIEKMMVFCLKSFGKRKYIIGHNVKDFDIPFIARRSSILGIEIIKQFNFYGRKPWELDHVLDTLDVWRMGNRYSKGSLEALSYAYGVDNPKEGLDGSRVHLMYLDKDFDGISSYCNGDVYSTGCLFDKMNGGSGKFEHKEKITEFYINE